MAPDLAGWRRERLPKLPDEAYFRLAPDWVCEVRGAANRRSVGATYRRIYAREQVPYAWLVDPIAQTLEALRLEHGRWVILSTWEQSAMARAEPFDAIDLDLTLQWEV